eukprot:8307979-Heterocapsa_arctica.AAC.1
MLSSHLVLGLPVGLFGAGAVVAGGCHSAACRANMLTSMFATFPAQVQCRIAAVIAQARMCCQHGRTRVRMRVLVSSQ